MKKLKLKLDGMKEMLSREQMQKINGGYDGNDVKCIVTYHDTFDFVHIEYICYGGGACEGSALDACPSGYSCWVDACWWF